MNGVKMTYVKKIKIRKLRAQTLLKENSVYSEKEEKTVDMSIDVIYNNWYGPGPDQSKQTSNKADWTPGHKQLE